MYKFKIDRQRNVLFVRVPWVCHQPCLCSVKTLQWKEKKCFYKLLVKEILFQLRKARGSLTDKISLLTKEYTLMKISKVCFIQTEPSTPQGFSWLRETEEAYM